MEKLQAALAKARNQRDGLPSRAGRLGRKTGGRSDPSAWDMIEKVSLSDTVLRQHRIVSQSADGYAGSFDVLRTKILMQMQENEWIRLAITSPGSGSGKSTIACNLALGLSRQNSVRTMLFDFDLGDPSAHTYFGIERKHSMSDVLEAKVPLKEHAVRISENVAVVVSPKVERDPTKLILSDAMEDFLDSAQKTFRPDIMLFDLPAMLNADRARAFLKKTDCALIVAMANKTRFSQLDFCEREVAESTNVLGVVMNGCHRSAMPQDDT